uniref:Uncharacterized protein n=1 Tax=Oryza rufipogon TaxID=4529 RepID=A0A0E0R1R3_ORYRU
MEQRRRNAIVSIETEPGAAVAVAVAATKSARRHGAAAWVSAFIRRTAPVARVSGKVAAF